MTTYRQAQAHRGYLERLTDADLSWLASREGSDALHAAVTRLRTDPGALAAALADRRTHQALLPDAGTDADPLLRASPFLLFAVAVHRAHAELADRGYLEEWVGARQRIPVFAGAQLHALLDDALLRLFLGELLASFTRVSSGSVWVQTARGPRRQRISDLDLGRLAELLEIVPTEGHPRVYRRLGDLALLLTGVFPDHTATKRFPAVDVARLGRFAGRGPAAAEALETRGAVGLLEELGSSWYRLSLEGAGGPPADTDAVLGTVAERFADVRRLLNYVTDRYVFPHRGRWFPAAV